MSHEEKKPEEEEWKTSSAVTVIVLFFATVIGLITLMEKFTERNIHPLKQSIGIQLESPERS